MRGRNPFLSAAEERRPTRPYTLRVEPLGVEFVVDPADLSDGDHGLVGSVLGECLKRGIDIDHTCGGVCACSTCHIYVERGASSCGEATEEEEDQLDVAPAVKSNSRLACQTVPDGSCDVTVRIPAWSRNEVKEGH